MDCKILGQQAVGFSASNRKTYDSEVPHSSFHVTIKDLKMINRLLITISKLRFQVTYALFSTNDSLSCKIKDKKKNSPKIKEA